MGLVADSCVDMAGSSEGHVVFPVGVEAQHAGVGGFVDEEVQGPVQVLAGGVVVLLPQGVVQGLVPVFAALVRVEALQLLKQGLILLIGLLEGGQLPPHQGVLVAQLGVEGNQLSVHVPENGDPGLQVKKNGAPAQEGLEVPGEVLGDLVDKGRDFPLFPAAIF